MVNASEIIAKSRKSNTGPVPITAQSGSAVLSAKDSDTITVGVSYGIYNVKTATCRNLCGSCNVYTDFFTTPDSFTLAVGGHQTLTATAYFQDGSHADETYQSTWTSSNSNVATNSGNLYTAVAPGSFEAIATAALEDGHCDDRDKYCIYPPQQTWGYGAVIPTISGPNTVWWFNGQNPSGYSTSITLQSDGGSSSTWSVSGNTAAVHLSTMTGATTTITATSTAWSSTPGDVKITATANGQSSSPYDVTTRKSTSLTDPTTSGGVCDSQWGYETLITYLVRDQMNIVIPTDVDYNEKWITGPIPVYQGTNWT
ncbi:MAG TPA: Ig-like domain-containing protein [Dongiaceae bacterium]|nr:Ig-like domain-containing protein [Dongiaceae bacterium]